MARKKIACVVTTYYTNSHADVVVGKFLRGFPTDEGLLPPGQQQAARSPIRCHLDDTPAAPLTRVGLPVLGAEVDVVSLYMDQLSDKDVGVALLQRHGVRICSTINEALCLGGSELAVDGASTQQAI